MDYDLVHEGGLKDAIWIVYVKLAELGLKFYFRFIKFYSLFYSKVIIEIFKNSTNFFFQSNSV